MKTLTKTLIAIFWVLSIPCFAQTITPLNSEHGKRAKGDFTITNNSFNPLAMTVDLMSATFIDGKFAAIDLLPSTHVKLSSYSARIPAKQSYSFSYQIVCDTYPCTTVIFATFATGAHTEEGMAVSMRLGTVVYQCDKEKNCRRSIQQ